MNSKILDWNSPLESLNRGRTSKNIQKLNLVDIHTIYHLLWVLPNSVETIPQAREFSQIIEGELFQGSGKVLSCRFRPNFFRKTRGRALLYNGSMTVKDDKSQETIELKWFNTYPNQKAALEKHEHIHFLGKASVYQNKNQIVSPEISDNSFEETSPSQAKYPTVNTVAGTYISRLLGNISDKLWDSLEEQVPEALKQSSQLMTLKRAFQILHGAIEVELEEYQNARRRLVFEEFTIEQKNLKVRRAQRIKIPESRISATEDDLKEAASIFPYQLTKGQTQANQDILKDLNSEFPMMRLIQGDVGCGKTTVAFIASLLAIQDGFQAALMCPTEALARQHFATFSKLCSEKNISCELLVGSTSAKEKKRINADLLDGKISLVIGTHALFQKTVFFKNLKLAIIDEQHKFGVDQRIALTEKGVGVNTLIMTATPIPRSLCMTHFGDLEISLIPELPSNRKGVQTRIVEEVNFQKFLAFIKARTNLGEQAYIVVPAIEESENIDIMYLEKVLSRFQKFFPQDGVEGIHGQLKADVKDQILRRFYDGDINILISTSVVEVGIDNPNASIMAIMNPERFGLSSLHQLRGRVGRGQKPGFCFLVCDNNTPEPSKHKLKILEKTASGFEISEQDLKLRGHGDLFGKQQSGNVSQYRIADIVVDMEILFAVREFFDSNDVIMDKEVLHMTTMNQRVTNTI